jgi:hypothetical protein
MTTVTDLIRDNKPANFIYADLDIPDGLTFIKYTDGNLYFETDDGLTRIINVEDSFNSDPPFCLWYTTEDGFEFPVPIDDLKGTHIYAREKAITLMSWIRKEFDRQKGEK